MFPNPIACFTREVRTLMELLVSKPDSLFYSRKCEHVWSFFLDRAQCVDGSGRVCRAIKTASGVNVPQKEPFLISHSGFEGCMEVSASLDCPAVQRSCSYR